MAEIDQSILENRAEENKEVSSETPTELSSDVPEVNEEKIPVEE